MTTENEWTELKTPEAAVKAQADGWEIEHSSGDGWVPWKGISWLWCHKYRARPAQLKMKKVKMLCWYDREQLFWVREHVKPIFPSVSVRVPAQDIEIEIPEDV